MTRSGGFVEKIVCRGTTEVIFVSGPEACRPARAYIGSVTLHGVTITGRINKLELREGQEVQVEIVLQTAAGHPATHQAGTESWESSNPAVASVVVDPANPLKAKIMGLDGSANEAAVISFHADGDPDADQAREVVATGDVVVTQGEAVVAKMNFGTPADSTPPA